MSQSVRVQKAGAFRFQFHLITCIAVMISGSFVLLLNVTPNEIRRDEIYAHYEKGILDIKNRWRGSEFGWPWVFLRELHEAEDEVVAPKVDSELGRLKFLAPGYIDYGNLGKNIFVGFLALLSTAIICEKVYSFIVKRPIAQVTSKPSEKEGVPPHPSPPSSNPQPDDETPQQNE